ncbi:MAG: 2'-5' RNA ligase family protein [Gemmatimonadota bacterium]|nr:2'-5' RNA ligase family protein [Gemmatimonadota bacterium]
MTRTAKSGIFIIAPITGPACDRIAALQEQHDPKILKLGRPHVTVAGSSGMGPIAANTLVTELKERLGPIAAETAPITLHFGRPTKFMQTEIVVLPLDPHGAIRTLHERIKMSGLRSAAPRFYFTPHVTLSLYRQLPPEALKSLLREYFDEPVVVDRIEAHLTKDTGESRKLASWDLSGDA